ncbi:MAG: hypothetical protein KDK36_02550 [Leptospiraceae bacterium]|nr:hypothetical protein [Leptospiraceae bacterium]
MKLFLIILLFLINCNSREIYNRSDDIKNYKSFNQTLFEKLNEDEKFIYYSTVKRQYEKESLGLYKLPKRKIRASSFDKTYTWIYINENLHIDKLSPKLRELVSKIAMSRSVEGRAVGFNQKKSEIYKIYEKACGVASKEEIIELSRYFHPIVRFYFIENLGKIDNLNSLEILWEHLNDNDEILFVNGDVARNYILGESYFEALFPKLSEKEKLEIRKKLKYFVKGKGDWKNKYL